MTGTATSPVSRIGVVVPGTGRITLHANANMVQLSELSSSYPLKLLSPRLPRPNVALVYALTYGGGLVAGDRIGLNVDVHDGAVLLILTQVRLLVLFTSARLTRLLSRVPPKSLSLGRDNVVHDRNCRRSTTSHLKQ